MKKNLWFAAKLFAIILTAAFIKVFPWEWYTALSAALLFCSGAIWYAKRQPPYKDTPDDE